MLVHVGQRLFQACAVLQPFHRTLLAWDQRQSLYFSSPRERGTTRYRMIVETLIQVLSELDSLFVLSISWPMLRRSLAVPMPRRTLAVPLSEPTRYMYM